MSVSNLVMSNVSRAEAALAPQGVTVSFGERFQASAQFDGVFKQGMALVERTAAYLEGPGRAARDPDDWITGGYGPKPNKA